MLQKSTEATFDATSPANSDGRSNGRLVDLPVLLQYWRVVSRWRWVILAIIGGTLLLGVIVTLLITPKYTATSTIEISRQQDKIVQVQDVRQESNSLDVEFYQTQYGLLTARSLADQVVKNLKLVDDAAFFKTMGVRLKGTGLFGVAQTGRLSEAQRRDRDREAIDTLLKHVTIDPVRGSRLVSISFTSPDPELSMRVTNEWTNDFIESNLTRRFDATAYARKFLETRLEQLRQKLEASERELVAYAGAQRIISIPSTNASGDRSDRPIVAEDLANLSTALSEAVADRVKAESLLAGVGPGRGGASTEALQNTAIATMRAKRAEAASDYAKILAQFEPGYPPAVALQRQVAEFDRAIAREEVRVQQGARTGFAEAASREQGLRSRVEALKDSLLDLRGRSIQYNIYQREVDTNRSLYDGLLQRYKEIGIAGGVGTNNIAVVDTAQLPDKPSSPKLLLNLAIALLLGLVLAGATTFGLEQIDEAVKDPGELERATGQPLLGAIPKAESGDPIELLNDRKSSQAEAYLSVQTALQFSSDHGVPRTIAVTSTRASEGKSVSAYALAMTLARTGRRVALVDGDMRSPSVHRMFDLANDRGTSNFLSGDDALDQLVVTDRPSGVSLMLAGGQPPNAAELLSGPRLGLLFERLLETHDHVVVDCPPVLGLADSPLIASRVEGVVYAVRAEGARARMIRQALARLDNANANILGVVLTMFVARRAHYGYGYDYGYGYGQDRSKLAGG